MGPFLRGNIHTHTYLSDGDSSPSAVASWYRERGYQFLALTDHNLVTNLSALRAEERKDFVLIPGEEVSMYHAGHQVHITALCTHETIGGGEFPSTSDALTWGIRHVQMQGGVALINHPNFDHAIAATDTPSFGGASLIEIFSGHPYVPSQGDATHPSHEALWDHALGSGMDLMGAAVDDMHHLESCGDPPAYPGKGWVYVSTPALNRDSICEALRKGRLVASTGPVLRKVVVTERSYEIDPEDGSQQVTFLGQGGRVLSTGARSYAPNGEEGYVRGRVDGPDSTHAWTPAVRVVGGSQ